MKCPNCDVILEAVLPSGRDQPGIVIANEIYYMAYECPQCGMLLWFRKENRK